MGAAGAAAILRNFAALEALPFEEMDPLVRGVRAGGVGLSTRCPGSGPEGGPVGMIETGPVGVGGAGAMCAGAGASCAWPGIGGE